MLTICALVALGQTASTAVTSVAVVDVSAPDAIYEDVSRALADEVVAALKGVGLQAIRIDERELPESGCRLGPCLGEAARAHGAQVVVMVDAAEGTGDVNTVALAGLWSNNGAPVAVAKYKASIDMKKKPKSLLKFALDVAKATR